PEEVRQATEEYKTEQDSVGEFIDHCCILDSNATTRVADLFWRYREWSRDSVLSVKSFGDRLAAKNFPRQKGTGGARMHKGLKLPEVKEENQNASGTNSGTCGS